MARFPSLLRPSGISSSKLDLGLDIVPIHSSVYGKNYSLDVSINNRTSDQGIRLCSSKRRGALKLVTAQLAESHSESIARRNTLSDGKRTGECQVI